MSTNANGRINLSVSARDERYPISVYLDGDIEPTFILKFNPADPFVLEYANNMSKLDAPDITGEDISAGLTFTERLEHNFDGIFGSGAARLICRYHGADFSLINALLEKVREGYDNYQKRAKEAAKAAKTKQVIDAKKEAQAFSAPQ